MDAPLDDFEEKLVREKVGKCRENISKMYFIIDENRLHPKNFGLYGSFYVAYQTALTHWMMLVNNLYD